MAMFLGGDAIDFRRAKNKNFANGRWKTCYFKVFFLSISFFREGRPRLLCFALLLLLVLFGRIDDQFAEGTWPMGMEWSRRSTFLR
jgi:hypothetical protein